jgi:hypothetical protein
VCRCVCESRFFWSGGLGWSAVVRWTIRSGRQTGWAGTAVEYNVIQLTGNALLSLFKILPRYSNRLYSYIDYAIYTQRQSVHRSQTSDKTYNVCESLSIAIYSDRGRLRPSLKTCKHFMSGKP